MKAWIFILIVTTAVLILTGCAKKELSNALSSNSADTTDTVNIVFKNSNIDHSTNAGSYYDSLGQEVDFIVISATFSDSIIIIIRDSTPEGPILDSLLSESDSAVIQLKYGGNRFYVLAYKNDSIINYNDVSIFRTPSRETGLDSILFSDGSVTRDSIPFNGIQYTMSGLYRRDSLLTVTPYLKDTNGILEKFVSISVV